MAHAALASSIFLAQASASAPRAPRSSPSLSTSLGTFFRGLRVEEVEPCLTRPPLPSVHSYYAENKFMNDAFGYPLTLRLPNAAPTHTVRRNASWHSSLAPALPRQLISFPSLVPSRPDTVCGGRHLSAIPQNPRLALQRHCKFFFLSGLERSLSTLLNHMPLSLSPLSPSLPSAVELGAGAQANLQEPAHVCCL